MVVSCCVVVVVGCRFLLLGGCWLVVAVAVDCKLLVASCLLQVAGCLLCVVVVVCCWLLLLLLLLWLFVGYLLFTRCLLVFQLLLPAPRPCCFHLFENGASCVQLH